MNGLCALYLRYWNLSHPSGKWAWINGRWKSLDFLR